MLRPKSDSTLATAASTCQGSPQLAAAARIARRRPRGWGAGGRGGHPGWTGECCAGRGAPPPPAGGVAPPAPPLSPLRGYAMPKTLHVGIDISHHRDDVCLLDESGGASASRCA